MTEPPYSWSSPSGDPSSPVPPAYQPPPIPQGYQYGQPAWVQPGVIPLRPLALGEILDGAIKVIRRYPRPTLGLSAAIALVVTVLNVVAVLLIGDHPLVAPTTGPDGELNFDSSETAASLAASVPAGLISFVAGLVLTGALIAVVGKAVQGQEAPAGEVWAAVRPRIWALIGLSLLTGVIVAAPIVMAFLLAFGLLGSGGDGALVLAIPLILGGLVASAYLYVRLALAPPAMMLEKTGVMTALRRSGVLARGTWWRLFGILLLTWLITLVVGAILVLPLGIFVVIFFGSGDGTPVLVAQQIAGGIASVLIAPFSAGVRALLYVDRRMRAEGLDVALRASVDPGTAG